MSLVAEYDTGRTRTINNAEWPIRHTMRRYSYGYMIATDVCGGDASMMRIEHPRKKRDAIRRWREITGVELR